MTEERESYGTTEEQRWETQAIELRRKTDILSVIATDEDLQAMASYLRTATAAVKAIKEHMAPQIEEANTRHKKLTAIRKRLLAPYEEIRSLTGDKIADYQARRQREIDAARREAEAAAQKAADDQRLAEAESLARRGRRAEAEAILEAPPPATPELNIQGPAKVEGVSIRRTWKANVFNLKALCAAIAQGKQPESLVEPNQSVLDGMARALKSNLNIPGVRATCHESTATRTE